MFRDSEFRGGFDSGSFAMGCMVGAGIMFMLDPNRGAKRRSYVRDKFVRAANNAGWYARKQARNLGNHISGSAAEGWAKLRDRRRDIPDDVLRERVRAQIGHVVRNAHSLDVESSDGHVIVSGCVQPGEAFKIEQRLLQTRGVHSYDLRVDESAAPEGTRRWTGREGRRRGEGLREAA